jgi:urease accessory protein
LLVALGAAVVGSLFGAFGGSLPAAEVLAALAVSGLGLALLARQRTQGSGGQGTLTLVLAAGVAVHAMLHGQEASGATGELLGWWLGAALSSSALVGLSFALLRQLGRRWTLALAAGLALAGSALALAPLA